jgi:hypothetical protein
MDAPVEEILKKGWPLVLQTILRDLQILIDEKKRTLDEPEAEQPRWMKRPVTLCGPDKTQEDLGHPFASFAWYQLMFQPHLNC